jgi:hypothetical protein
VALENAANSATGVLKKLCTSPYHRERCLSDLAWAFDLFAKAKVGQDEIGSAIPLYEEATQYYVELVEKDFNQYGRLCARSMLNYAALLHIKNMENADATRSHALSLYERLMENDMFSHGPSYADALHDYACDMASIQDVNTAFEFGEMVIGVWQRLFDQGESPGHVHTYARALGAQALRADSVGKATLCIGYGERGMVIYARLDPEKIDEYAQDWLTDCKNLIADYAQLNDDRNSLRLTQLRLKLAGKLFLQEPADYAIDILHSMSVIKHCSEQLDCPLAWKEAVEMFVELDRAAGNNEKKGLAVSFLYQEVTQKLTGFQEEMEKEGNIQNVREAQILFQSYNILQELSELDAFA